MKYLLISFLLLFNLTNLHLTDKKTPKFYSEYSFTVKINQPFIIYDTRSKDYINISYYLVVEKENYLKDDNLKLVDNRIVNENIYIGDEFYEQHESVIWEFSALKTGKIELFFETAGYNDNGTYNNIRSVYINIED